MPRITGELVSWRGVYGFLRPDGGPPDVFVNLAAMEHAGAGDPTVGERFSFLVEDDDSGRARAIDLRREGVDAAARAAFNPIRP